MGQDRTASTASHTGKAVQENKNTDISGTREQAETNQHFSPGPELTVNTSNALGLVTSVNVVSSKQMFLGVTANVNSSPVGLL